MNKLIERLRSDVYGNLTLGAIERADLDGMAFAVEDAIKALEAADRMADAVDAAQEKAGVPWISPRIAVTRRAYRNITQETPHAG